MEARATDSTRADNERRAPIREAKWWISVPLNRSKRMIPPGRRHSGPHADGTGPDEGRIGVAVPCVNGEALRAPRDEGGDHHELDEVGDAEELARMKS